MSEIFAFGDRAIRFVGTADDPWWVAADICGVLEIKNVTQALDRLDDDERSMFNIGRQGEAWCVNESGLYALILSSRKAQAKQFKKWVTSEVLPAIRKTGKYELETKGLDAEIAKNNAIAETAKLEQLRLTTGNEQEKPIPKTKTTEPTSYMTAEELSRHNQEEMERYIQKNLSQSQPERDRKRQEIVAMLYRMTRR